MTTVTELTTIDDIIKYVPKNRIDDFINEFKEILQSTHEFLESKASFTLDGSVNSKLSCIDHNISYELKALLDFGGEYK